MKTLFLLSCCLLAWAAPAIAVTQLDVVIDGRELPRRLLHSKTTVDLPAGRTSFLYVKWVPGIHGPRGPVENIGSFTVENDKGTAIPWIRDWSDPHRFFVDAPSDGRYTLSLTYITNQPSTNSKSVDSYGYPNQGVINSNTVVLYPEGPSIREIEVACSLLLPEGWSYGTALVPEPSSGSEIRFAPTDFEDFVDKPIIAGRHLASYELADTENARWNLHVSADEAHFIPEEDDSLLVPFRDLCLEAEALFGRTHFEEYHILLALSDDLGLGLEHRNSSLNSDDADTFDDKDWLETGVEVLIPHEVSHAWVGKYRRPVGMFNDDFHAAKNTELLWVYEGLDEYAGLILASRAGFRSAEVSREGFALGLSSLIHQKGRDWRPLGDTASAGWTLRGGSKHWGWMRRGQDYYNEGSFIWLEADVRIRMLSEGKKSLDDFCSVFFGSGDPAAPAVPFDREEIIETLAELAPYDWAGFFATRVDRIPGDELPQGIELSGWKLTYSDEKTGLLETLEKIREYARLYDSIGMVVKKDGTIGSIVPGSAAHRAGLVDGLEIVGIDGLRFSIDRLIDAVRESSEGGSIELLIDESEHLKTITLEYSGGLRYFVLERDDSKPDILSEILRPRTRE